MLDLVVHLPLVKSSWECFHFQFVYLNKNLIWVFPFGNLNLLPVTSVIRPHGRFPLFWKFGASFQMSDAGATHLSANTLLTSKGALSENSIFYIYFLGSVAHKLSALTDLHLNLGWAHCLHPQGLGVMGGLVGEPI